MLNKILSHNFLLKRVSLNKVRLGKVFRTVLLWTAILGVAQLWAQTSTTGELGGTVTDPCLT
jgi:hypothetical protein